MTISEKVHNAKMAFASGELSTDQHGFLHVAGHGDIKLSDEFVASVGRTPRPTGSTQQRWETAVEAAMVSTGGNRLRATAMAAKKHPSLRQQLIAEANATRQKPAARATSQPVAKINATASFKLQVEELMEQGLTKMEAARQLSKQMGLSQEPRGNGHVSRRSDYR